MFVEEESYHSILDYNFWRIMWHWKLA